MKTLVIGYGSIGQRHARLLVEMGCDVAILSRRSTTDVTVFADLKDALASWHPDYVVIANRSSEHLHSMRELVQAGYRGRVLIEKPLCDRECASFAHDFSHVAVGYNLRFEPMLERLKALVREAVQISVASIYVGSYLPGWRPNVDYRSTYSASTAQGGGVLRDLSHELDYAHWMFGAWRRLTASGGHLSSLAIDSDDAFTVIMESDRCPLVTIHLNYLDRVSRRTIVVNADDETYGVDLVQGTFAIGDRVESVGVARDDTYRAEHRAMMTGDMSRLCTLAEATETVMTVEAAERAAASHLWLSR